MRCPTRDPADRTRKGEVVMTQHAPTHRARLHLERLEDRCTPSALLGDPPAHAAAPPGGPPAQAAALAAGPRQHAVPIHLSTPVTSDGSLALSLTGVGGHLGRLAGQGVVDNVVIDEGAGQIAASGTATFVAANGDQLFVSFSVSFNLTTL